MPPTFGPCLLLTALLALGCTAPSDTLVARERAVPGPMVTPDRARGRVSMVDGQVVSDIGTPLRGLTLPVDFDWTLDDFDLMTTIAQTTGLNTVHVFLENWEQPTGSKQANADALVSLTAQAGLYLVLSIGGGKPGPDHPGNGWFSLDKVKSFWTFYAPRYAASTHVLFEIQNNPEITCDSPLKDNTISMEREAYSLIRGLAPDSHIVLFSTSSVPRKAVVEQAIDSVSDLVDFSNASFAMHDDAACTPLAGLTGVFDAAAAKGVPVIVSALPSDGWPDVVSRCESRGVGWLQHRWLAYETTLDGYFEEAKAAKLSWCPDQGDFPEAAAGCR